MNWKTSSTCKADEPMCAEVMTHPNGEVSIRKSTDPEISIIFSEREWEAFAAGVKAGEF